VIHHVLCGTAARSTAHFETGNRAYLGSRQWPVDCVSLVVDALDVGSQAPWQETVHRMGAGRGNFGAER